MRVTALFVLLELFVGTSSTAFAQPHRHNHWHNRPPVSVYLGGYYGPPPPVAYYAPYPWYGGYYSSPSLSVQITRPAPVVRIAGVQPTLASPPPPAEPPRPIMSALPRNPEPQFSAAIRLINPRENGVTIAYSLGDRIKSLAYGQDKVTYVAGPTDIVFNRGRDLGQRRYTLDGGTYEFRHLGEEGWDLLPLPGRTAGPASVNRTPTPLPGLSAPSPAPLPTETVIPGLPPLPAP